MNIIEKMEEYNKLINRHIKAEEFFNSEISNDKKLLALDDYMKLITKLKELQIEIQNLGYTFRENDFKYGIGRSKNDGCLS